MNTSRPHLGARDYSSFLSEAKWWFLVCALIVAVIFARRFNHPNYERVLADLNDPDVMTRALAASYVAQSPDRRAVIPLLHDLADLDQGKMSLPVPTNRKPTAPLFGPSTIQWQPEFVKKEDLMHEFQRALGRAAPLGLDELINAFADANVNNYAFEFVVKAGSVAVGPLIGALQNHDRTVQGFAARALAEIKDKRGVAPLLQIIRTDAGACEHVATAVGSFGKEVVDPLLAMADDQTLSEFGRALAMRALAETRDVRAVPLLLRFVAGKGRLREAAREALDQSDPAVIANVVNQTGDPAFAAKTYVYLIRRGVPGTEGLLVRALNIYGDTGMAEVFLNCDNNKLVSSARRWAGRNGYAVTNRTATFSGTHWGAAR